jgi:hypothetical protein
VAQRIVEDVRLHQQPTGVDSISTPVGRLDSGGGVQQPRRRESNPLIAYPGTTLIRRLFFPKAVYLSNKI